MGSLVLHGTRNMIRDKCPHDLAMSWLSLANRALGENPLALNPAAILYIGILDLLMLCRVRTAGGALDSIIMLLPPMPL